MSPPTLADVFFKATLLAQQSGASEINIQILLAALDALPDRKSSNTHVNSGYVLISTQSDRYAFSINNSDWTPVSAQTAKVLGQFDGMEEVDHATLRKALRAAQAK